MKTLIVPIILVCMVCMTSCQKETLDPANTSYENLITPGTEIETAKTTLFREGGIDKTAQFSQYNFKFNCNGTVEAEVSGDPVTGTWQIVNDSESNPGNVIFNFSSAPLNEMNGQWQILEQVSSRMRLQQIGSGIITTDLLTFEKF